MFSPDRFPLCCACSDFDRTASAALVRAVHRETEGNPFFVDEIVQLLVADGTLRHGEASIPGKLPIPQGGRDERKRTREDAPWQLEDLICHLMNLADDLETGLAQGTVAPKRCRR